MAPNRRAFEHQGAGVKIESDGVTVGTVIGANTYLSKDFIKRHGTEERAKLALVRGVQSGKLKTRIDPGARVPANLQPRRPLPRTPDRDPRWFATQQVSGLRTYVPLSGNIKIKDAFPSPIFGVDFDVGEHIRKGLCDQIVQDDDVESGGTQTLNLELPAGYSGEAAAFILEMTQESDEGVTLDGTVTVTFQSKSRNLFNAQDSFVADGAGTTLHIGAKVDTVNSFRFAHPPGMSRTLGFFFSKPSEANSAPHAVPALAMLVTPTNAASAEVAKKSVTIVIDSTSGGKLVASAKLLIPGTTDYVDAMRDVFAVCGGT